MSPVRIVGVALVLLLTAGGCSRPTPPVAVRSAPTPEVYEPVYRAATELRSAQEVGMDRRRFGELLQKFATELTLARDRARAGPDQRVIQGYDEVLRIYKDAASVWDVKIRVPEIKELAEQQAQNAVGGGSTDLIIPSMEFQNAISEGIPLNLFRPGSTGLDDIVARYKLPVTDTKGWKTIPNDSVERVCTQAKAKAEEVARLQKG